MSVLGTRSGRDNLISGDFPIVTDSATVVTGQTLVRGSLLGRVTATGKYKLSLSAASDGSETPIAVASEAVDASAADKKTTIYVSGEFDCSQMSAFVERKLENEGYHTVIVTGEAPFGDGKHAWLLVETTEGKYMPVEATIYSIIYWSSPYFDEYFEYEFKFETINEALQYSPSEFNWWD